MVKESVISAKQSSTRLRRGLKINANAREAVRLATPNPRKPKETR